MSPSLGMVPGRDTKTDRQTEKWTDGWTELPQLIRAIAMLALACKNHKNHQKSSPMQCTIDSSAHTNSCILDNDEVTHSS